VSGPVKHVLRAAQIEADAFRFRHPLGGDNSEVVMSMLGRAAGLSRIGVNLARVPPGKEAFVYHRHRGEEEWVFILEGEGRSDIDDVTEPVGPGDFIAYPDGCAHSLFNTGDRDLVYLMGGEVLRTDIAEFPRHKKRILLVGDDAHLVDEADCQSFTASVEMTAENSQD
jgi:uncharacterized cupin superfamily protein